MAAPSRGPTSTAVALDGLEAARSLREITHREAASSEAQRTLSAPMVDALWASGLMTYLNAPEAGGCEPSFAEVIETWIELAWQDGSLGWIGIANFPSAMAASVFLPDAGFGELFGDPNARVTVGGQFFPNGTGDATGDGYVAHRLVELRIRHRRTPSTSRAASSPSSTARRSSTSARSGPPSCPASEVTFTDGWHVQGLRGTGSYDYSVSEVFVPEDRCFRLFSRDPQRGSSPLFRHGPHARDGRRSRELGARRVEEHARRRRRAGTHEGADVRHGDPRPPPDVPAEPRALHRHVARGARGSGGGLRRGRAGRRGGRTADPSPPGRHACRGHLRHGGVAGGRAVGAPRRGNVGDPRRAADSSGRSATCTPARSTPSSARRPTSTRRRSGSGSRRIFRGSELPSDSEVGGQRDQLVECGGPAVVEAHLGVALRRVLVGVHRERTVAGSAPARVE